MVEHNEYMKEAYDKLEKTNADKALRYQYLREEMAASDETTIRNACFREGEKSGIAQGIVQGITQGITQGIAQGIAQEAQRYSQLILKLVVLNRQEEIVKAATDSMMLQRLYNEFEL